VITVAVGGLPHNEKMSFSTFPGGLVFEDKEIMSIFDAYNMHDDPNRPHEFGTSASVRFAFLELYLSISSTKTPEEFTFYPADHRIKFWPGNNEADTKKLYDMVVPLFKK